MVFGSANSQTEADKRRGGRKRIGAEAAQCKRRTILTEVKEKVVEDLGFQPFGKIKVVRYCGKSWTNFLERQKASAKQRFSRQPYYG